MVLTTLTFRKTLETVFSDARECGVKIMSLLFWHCRVLLFRMIGLLCKSLFLLSN